MSRTTPLLAALAIIVGACGQPVRDDANPSSPREMSHSDEPDRPDRFADMPVGDTVSLSDAEWRERLTPFEYQILRQQGTERAFTGRFYHHHEDGTYRCAGCGAPLYSSSDKYESGSGWPSYTRAIEEGRVRELRDASHGMVRVELRCARCDGHLGHVFEDGPAPTGRRHCINSASLDFDPSSDDG